MDAKGFHMVKTHIESRRSNQEEKVWDFHVVNYIAEPEYGFCVSAAREGYNIFIVFVFGSSVDHDQRTCFKSFFLGLDDLKQVFNAKETRDYYSYWHRLEVPYLKIRTAIKVFRRLACHDFVLVHVNGGLEFTYLRLVNFYLCYSRN